jgi:peptidoglycan/xylan/chitin deacetylase (PgdA/CDA1 family)
MKTRILRTSLHIGRWSVVSLSVGVLVGACGGEGVQDQIQREAESNRCSGTVPPDRGPFGNRVALTFDDGPSLTNTPKVMDILEQHGATATFFVNGKNVTTEEHRALLRDMVSRGHLVGNHSQTHANCSELAADDFLENEVIPTEEAIQSATEQTPTFFRFPFGAGSCDTISALESRGYAYVGWHIDTADWCFNAGKGYCSPSTFKWVDDQYRRDYIGYTLSQLPGKQGGILLMHDVHNFTVGQLDKLLTALENEGYTFAQLSDGDLFPTMNAGR